MQTRELLGLSSHKSKIHANCILMLAIDTFS